MASVTPLGALARGVLAGAAGSGIMSVYFKATSKVAPPPPEGAFVPVEDEQHGESSMETVARRVVEKLAVRGPLTPSQKEAGGVAVHYLFGAGWGGLWGLARESYPPLNGPLGVTAFSSLVWMVGDNVILPGFKLGGAPRNYPARFHLFGWAAHLVYGVGVWAAYESSRRDTWAALGAVALTLRRRKESPAARWTRKARVAATAAGHLAGRPLKKAERIAHRFPLAESVGLMLGLLPRPRFQALEQRGQSAGHDPGRSPGMRTPLADPRNQNPGGNHG